MRNLLIYFSLLLIFASCQTEQQTSAVQTEKSGKSLIYPLLRGDYPDPSIVMVEDTFYMTHSSFDYYPGLLIWKSVDLVNWEPVTRALTKDIGSVWAPDIIYYDGLYYIYIPANHKNWVITAPSPEGPWSEPVMIDIRHIDPGHIVTPEDERYLMFSSGWITRLEQNGLEVKGEPEKVYDGWPIPEDWIVECVCLESPKLFYREPYYHLTVAEGGTAGPSTSHMAVMARAESIHGPWENSPYNPVIHTWSKEEKWWSTGHGTAFSDQSDKWWMVYHGYEKDYLTLGRQSLLSPMKWTDDDWLVLDSTANPDQLLDERKEKIDPSDDFENNDLGWQWSFFKKYDPQRFRLENGSLYMIALGDNAGASNPIAVLPMDQAYEMTAEVEVTGDAEGGLLMFYNENWYSGIGFKRGELYQLREGQRNEQPAPADFTKSFLKIINDYHEVTIYTSEDGENWSKVGRGVEMSGFHHNMLDGFLGLRAALYATGDGEVRFDNFTYTPRD